MKKVVNLQDFYVIGTPFRIRHVISPDFIPWDRIRPQKMMLGLYYVQCLFFSLTALSMSIFMSKDVYYSRDLQARFWLCLTKAIHREIFFEAHEVHGRREHNGTFGLWTHRLMRWMMRRLTG